MTSLVGPILAALTLGRSANASSGFQAAARQAMGRNSLLFPAILLTIGALRGLSYFGQFYLMGMIGQRVASRLRKRVLAALVKAGPRFLTSQRSGDLLSRLSGDAASVEFAVTYGLAALMRDPLTAALLFAVCVALDWRLALLAFGLLPLTIAFLAPPRSHAGSEGWHGGPNRARAISAIASRRACRDCRPSRSMDWKAASASSSTD
jgi:ABC-type multidrug transport system fused ATPase/permease subunit